MTYKITYNRPNPSYGIKGVAFCEGDTEQCAVMAFKEDYAGKYRSIDKVQCVETGQYFQ